METIAHLMLLAALLPLLTAAASKLGGKAFDNAQPRAWLARQEGWRARGDAAQKNLFEGLPFFYAAVLFALYHDADPGSLFMLMSAWLLLRVLYVLCYFGNTATLRSLIWILAFGVNIAMLYLRPTG